MSALMLELLILRIIVVVLLFYFIARWFLRLFFVKSDCFGCAKRLNCGTFMDDCRKRWRYFHPCEYYQKEV
ncbi:MAG: hypothetical protein V2A78_03200 [bacterium]